MRGGGGGGIFPACTNLFYLHCLCKSFLGGQVPCMVFFFLRGVKLSTAAILILAFSTIWMPVESSNKCLLCFKHCFCFTVKIILREWKHNRVSDKLKMVLVIVLLPKMALHFILLFDVWYFTLLFYVWCLLSLVGDKTSDDFNLNCGVPQGSCMGPVFFTLYVSRLFNIIYQHLPSVHGYADDT